jgi:hypothetical protein
MLVYVPSKRLTMLEACAHRFFDELRHPGFMLPGGEPVPPLFNFTEQELLGASIELRNSLVPQHARAKGWRVEVAATNVPPPHDPSPYAAAYVEAYPQLKAGSGGSEAAGGGGARAGGGGGGAERDVVRDAGSAGVFGNTSDVVASLGAGAAALGGAAPPLAGGSQRSAAKAADVGGERRLP